MLGATSRRPRKEQYRGRVEGVVSGAWRDLTRLLNLWTDSRRGWRGRVEGLNQAAQSDADWGPSSRSRT